MAETETPRREVVVIERSGELSAALARFLGRMDARIVNVPDLAAGCDALRARPGALVVALVAEGPMPDVLTPLAALREAAPNARRVFIAAAGDAEAAVMAQKAGAAAYAAPVSLGDLLVRLNGVLGPPGTVPAPKPAPERLPPPPDPDALAGGGLPADMTPCDFPALFAYSLLDISASGLGLRLPFAPPVGTVLEVRLPEAMKKMGCPLDTALPVRVLNSRAIDPGRAYAVGTEFVTLPPGMEAKIRALCRK